MEKKNKYSEVLIELFQEILEEDNLEHALAGSLEILVRALKSEVGVIWLWDKKTDRLVPMFETGPLDLSNLSVELGTDIESYGEIFVFISIDFFEFNTCSLELGNSYLAFSACRSLEEINSIGKNRYFRSMILTAGA